MRAQTNLFILSLYVCLFFEFIIVSRARISSPTSSQLTNKSSSQFSTQSSSQLLTQSSEKLGDIDDYDGLQNDFQPPTETIGTSNFILRIYVRVVVYASRCGVCKKVFDRTVWRVVGMLASSHFNCMFAFLNWSDEYAWPVNTPLTRQGSLTSIFYWDMLPYPHAPWSLPSFP